MKEDMDILDLMMADINEFCNDKGIEYVFGAVSKDGEHFSVANNELSNIILKKSLKIISTITGDILTAIKR